ncbi:Uncharacterised protein [uncultured archaeon]|nr:Uncharacterised protein [uncultured archaeon]
MRKLALYNLFRGIKRLLPEMAKFQEKIKLIIKIVPIDEFIESLK